MLYYKGDLSVNKLSFESPHMKDGQVAREQMNFKMFVNTERKVEMVLNELAMGIVTSSTIDFTCCQGLRLLVSI